jgi:hypothetical protein
LHNPVVSRTANRHKCFFIWFLRFFYPFWHNCPLPPDRNPPR